MNIFNVLVSGVPLAFVVLGLVEWTRGLKDNWENWQLQVISMAYGLVFGVAYMVYADGWPGWVFAPLFGYLFYGLGLGLVASGIYDVAKGILARSIEKLMGNGGGPA